MLNIAHQIIQAPRAGASKPQLVAAVSNAGGLGSYGGGATAPDQLRSIIRQIRELTDQPFAVNLFAPAVEAYQLTPEQQTPRSELLAKWHNELDAGPVPKPIPILGPFVDQFTEVFSGKPARATRNRFIREMENNRDKVLPFPAQMSIGRILRQTSAQQSSPDFVSMWAGQGAALAEALPADEPIKKILQDFQAVTASLPKILGLKPRHKLDDFFLILRLLISSLKTSDEISSC